MARSAAADRRHKLAGLDQRGDGRPILCSSVMPSKQSVLAVERYRPNGSLDAVVVDLDAAVSQEDAKAVPVFSNVSERFAERRLASDAGAMMSEPDPHVYDQRR